MEDKYVEKIIETEARSKSNLKRLDEQESEIKELRKTYSLMETMVLRIGNVEKNVESINNKLDEHEKEIQEESTKEFKQKSIKWDKIIDYLFYALLAAALFKLGLK